MVVVYLSFLVAGVLCFALHYLAQYRLASYLRRRYPQQWKIIAIPEQGKPGAVRTWLRLQQVLRSSAPLLFDDNTITGWHRTWRFSQWLAWGFWLAALALQWLAR
ncbi:MAG: hypothetical protein ABW154_03890 [Dyella sp.]